MPRSNRVKHTEIWVVRPTTALILGCTKREGGGGGDGFLSIFVFSRDINIRGV